METAEKSGKVKLTMELEINPAAMDLIKENMSHMVDMASQWRGQSSKGKMESAHSMIHGEEKS
ncbi:MAG: hypothetical protein NWE96_07910 [Candidatus Bathyarchaeota archaeon]|nr:hypothetical protein [Candidatus Bathyarchaeota archaeon]